MNLKLKLSEEVKKVCSVLFEQQGPIGYITLNRPEVMNAFNFDMLQTLSTYVDSIRINPDIRLVIIQSSSDRAFSVGADLKERKALPAPLVIRNLNKFAEVFTNIEHLPQPTICVLNGYAFGGGFELALACDFRIASTTAIVGLTETSLGIIPGAGGTQRLPRLIGETKAKELIFTSRRVTADEGYAIGLYTKIADPSSLHATVSEFADAILANAPIAVQQAKFAIGQGVKVDLHTGLQIERKAYEVTIPTEDRIEALNAFAEKRKPIFKGK